MRLNSGIIKILILLNISVQTP